MMSALHMPPRQMGIRFPAGATFCGRTVWRGEFEGTIANPLGTSDSDITPIYADSSVRAVVAARGHIITTDGLMRGWQYKCHNGTGGGTDYGSSGYLSALTIGVGKLISNDEYFFLVAGTGFGYTSSPPFRRDHLMYVLDNGLSFTGFHCVYLWPSGGAGSPTFENEYYGAHYKLQVDWIEGE